MKITRSQLRRIIREAHRRVDEGLHGVIAGPGFGAPPMAPPSVYSSHSAQSPASVALKRSARTARPTVSELGISRYEDGFDEYQKDALEDLRLSVEHCLAVGLTPEVVRNKVLERTG